MSVEIEGLEFQVEAKSDKGADGIDKLANSFKNLKSAIKGGTNLNGSIKQLEKLNQALSGLHTDKLESLGKVSRVLALGFMTMYSSRSLMASSLRLVFTVLQPLWLNRVDIS